MAEKLESLRNCINRIIQKRPSTIEELQDNLDLQDILSVNLERAVQLCVDIGTHIIAQTDHPAPSSFGETFEVLEKMGILDAHTTTRMKKAVGFRNVAVHTYQQINWEIVFHICHKDVDDFTRFAKQINGHFLA